MTPRWVKACGAIAVAAIVTFLVVAFAAPPAWAGEAMRLIVQAAVAPAAFLSLLSGLFSSLGTQWGLPRHYWVIFKLLINLVASVVLLLYTQSMGPNPGPTDVVHAGGALILLIAATVLAVHKPRGTTAGARRKALP